jgi:hypothetical protein
MNVKSIAGGRRESLGGFELLSRYAHPSPFVRLTLSH